MSVLCLSDDEIKDPFVVVDPPLGLCLILLLNIDVIRNFVRLRSSIIMQVSTTANKTSGMKNSKTAVVVVKIESCANWTSHMPGILILPSCFLTKISF